MKKIRDLVKFLEENNSNMFDYSLIDNLRDLNSLKSKKECALENEDYSATEKKVWARNHLSPWWDNRLICMTSLFLRETHFKMEMKVYLRWRQSLKIHVFLCNVESDNLERINMRNKIKKKHRYRCKWCLCNRQWWYVCHWQ